MSTADSTQRIELALSRARLDDRRDSLETGSERLARVRERRGDHRATIDALREQEDALAEELQREARTLEVVLDFLPMRRTAEDVQIDQSKNAVRIDQAELALQAEKVRASDLFEALRSSEGRAERGLRAIAEILEDRQRAVRITNA